MARVTMPPGEVTLAHGTLTARGVRVALLQPNRTAPGSITITPQSMLDPTADPDVYILATSEPRPPHIPDTLTLDELRASIHRVLGIELPITGAHLFSAGGTALNAGLLDAVNLGWKLAATVRGTAPTGLLDTYQAERHPAGRRAILHTRAQAALSASGENAQALREVLAELLRHPGPLAHLATLMEGADVTYGHGPLIGTQAPDTLDKRAAEHAIKHLRSGRSLLIDTMSDAKLTVTMEPWRQRLDVVEAPGCGASALIRPDGYLAWAGDSSDELHASVVTWFGAP